MQLYSFGFNAFHQTGDFSNLTVAKTCHSNVKQVLFTSWETTIILDDTNQLIVWGFKPIWFHTLLEQCKNKIVKAIFGDPNELLGTIDQDGFVSIVTNTENKLNMCKADNVVYCSTLDSMFVLYQGTVQQYTKNKVHTLSLKNVKSMCGSNSHVLFSADYVYGLGSNRLSQLGIDYEQQDIKEPELIEYFCGLGKVTDMACGPFHSVVIIEGDVYTFGWHNENRLGRDKEEDMIGLATFQVDNKHVEINAVKVVCGSSHTLVLDDQGNVWSCGSNTYTQLCRKKSTSDDTYFGQCEFQDSKIKSIYAGKWTSFIMI